MKNKLIEYLFFIFLKTMAFIRFVRNIFYNRREGRKKVTFLIRTDYSRYLVSLILFFVKNGYNVRIVLNREFWSILNKYWFDLSYNKYVSIVLWSKKNQSQIFSDTIFLNNNRLSLKPNYYYPISEELLSNNYKVPFSLHPMFYFKELDSLNLEKVITRKFKLVFAGNLSGIYKNIKCFDEVYLSRVVLVEILMSKFSQYVHFPKTKNELYSTDKPICIIDISNFWLDKKEYISFLSNSDFGLCPVGLRMPFCHNLIECIYTGTIPVLQYNKLLNPELQHLVECISFDGNEYDFISKINMILSGEIHTTDFTNNLFSYYQNNLSPSAVIQQIENLQNLSDKNLFLLAGEAGELSMSLAERE
ncbi:hypothetical protein D770_08210 [Flammeovirgaceae bacterium 311]|nr:hypothetical protein D770_08210 [Flammeovirgaceae bacterium 311]